MTEDFSTAAYNLAYCATQNRSKFFVSFSSISV